MQTFEEIRELLKRFTEGNTQVFPAVIQSVNGEGYTAVVKPLNEPEMRVRLKASANSELAGFALVPTVGSTVLVSLIMNNPDSGVVIAVDHLEDCEIRANSITLNDGENGGLIIHEQLLNQYNKTKRLLDAIVSVINGSPIPEPGAGAASVLQTSLKAAIAGLSTGDLSQITNDQIKH